MNSLYLIKKANNKSEHLIIFVHGFTGGFNTFKHKDKHFSDYLSCDILNTCDIYEFRYYSSIFNNTLAVKLLSYVGLVRRSISSNYNIDMFKYSQLLETHYSNYCSKYKSINIISHSMGGLIAKQFIIETVKKLSCFNGFYISLATPHRGVSEAKLLLLLNNPFINSMEPFSAFIDETSRDWAIISPLIKRKYYCATHDSIVDDRSACPAEDTRYRVRVEGTHTTIAKPSSNDCSLVKNINSTIAYFLGISSSKHSQINTLSADDILFYAYKPEYRPNYLIRNADNDIINILKLNNLWICGQSGTGKTNLIQYYLISNDRIFLSFDMSPCPPDISSKELLSNLYWSLRTQLEPKYSLPKRPDENRSWIDHISDLLSIIAHDKEVYLFIDEFHMLSSDLFETFIDNITTITSIYKNNRCTDGNIVLIVSTIKEPISCDNLRFRSKFNTLFTVYTLNYWSNAEITDLYNILVTSLGLLIDDTNKSKAILCSKGSPRRLKLILKKYINLKSMDSAIFDVESEGVY